MSSKLYVGQPIDIKIKVFINGVAMSTGASSVIQAKKPSGTILDWTATVDNVEGEVTYDATALEIDESGPWILQPVVTLAGVPSKTIPGTPKAMVISPRFS